MATCIRNPMQLMVSSLYHVITNSTEDDHSEVACLQLARNCHRGIAIITSQLFE